MLKHIWIAVNILFFTIIIFPQENFVFENFSIPQGLSNPTINTIIAIANIANLIFPFLNIFMFTIILP